MGRAEGQLGHYRAGRERLNAGLQVALDVGESATAAKALSLLAFAAYREGNFAEMRPLGSEALALARAAGNAVEEARALSTLGNASIHEHDLSLARSYHEQGLALARQVGERRVVAAILTNLGEVSRAQGDLTGAARCYEDALAELVKLGDRRATLVPLFNLGEVAAAQKEPAKAARYYQEGLTLAQELGVGFGSFLGGLGYVAAEAGDVTAAGSFFARAVSRGRAIGDVPLVLYALVGFARVKALAGEHIGAAEWLGLALHHPSAETDVRGRAHALLSELRVALPAEELDAALARGAKMELDAVVGEILKEA